MTFEPTVRHRKRAASIEAPASTRVLLVEADSVLRRTLAELLTASGFEVSACGEGESAMQLLQHEHVDVVLTDRVMTGTGGTPFPNVPVILMTSLDGGGSAGDVKPAGSAEYLSNPLLLDRLMSTLRRVLEATSLQRERARAARQFGVHLGNLIGSTRSMKALCAQVSRVAMSSMPVLITGETGVGKELIALGVHDASGRGSFLPVNCSAIPAALLESELFGHVRGAFTGADADRIGLFEAADGGTIFLDEIGELPIGLQSKLLRVLQSGELRRVGDTAVRHVDVRLIAATHRDLEAGVEHGTFRRDLFYRINVLQLHVPPLRERATDVPLLADQFLIDIAAREKLPTKRFTPAAHLRLSALHWPGNVRQLRNVVERLALLTDGELIDVDDLTDEISGISPTTTAVRRVGEEITLADLEREHTLAVLKRLEGNRSRTARVLGIPRRTLYRRLAEYGITAE